MHVCHPQAKEAASLLHTILLCLDPPRSPRENELSGVCSVLNQAASTVNTATHGHRSREKKGFVPATAAGLEGTLSTSHICVQASLHKSCGARL